MVRGTISTVHGVVFAIFCPCLCGAPPHSMSKTRVNALMGVSKTRLESFYRADLAARGPDARDGVLCILDHGRHVMRVGVHDGLGVAHDRHMALPEDQIAALQFF